VVETPSASFELGAEIGSYVIERKLAEGGMGIVLSAMHRELRHRVAIKRLKPAILFDKALVERFRREAMLAASLRSEHVVRIFDIGTTPSDGPFIVMEYLEGEDLGARLARGPLPLEDVADYIIQACDAVAEAHGLGIVHRDLKPENFFLARHGTSGHIIKVLDFGISKAQDTGTALGTGLPRMTDAGDRFGTPLYMSPEQLTSARDVDTRADIWALGVVTFELLTGKLPFAGNSIATLTANILTAPPTKLRAHLPHAPLALEALLDACFAKDPTRRVQSVATLVEGLRAFAPPPSGSFSSVAMRSVDPRNTNYLHFAATRHSLGVDPSPTPHAFSVRPQKILSSQPPPLLMLPTSSPKATLAALSLGAVALVGVAALTVNLSHSHSRSATTSPNAEPTSAPARLSPMAGTEPVIEGADDTAPTGSPAPTEQKRTTPEDSRPKPTLSAVPAAGPHSAPAIRPNAADKKTTPSRFERPSTASPSTPPMTDSTRPVRTPSVPAPPGKPPSSPSLSTSAPGQKAPAVRDDAKDNNTVNDALFGGRH